MLMQSRGSVLIGAKYFALGVGARLDWGLRRVGVDLRIQGLSFGIRFEESLFRKGKVSDVGVRRTKHRNVFMRRCVVALIQH